MLFIAVFFIVVLYVVLFVVRIKAAIDYIRNEKNEWVKFSFYTRKGIIRYEYKVPLVKQQEDKVRFKLVKGQSAEMRQGSEINERLMPLDIIMKYKSVRNYLKDHRSLLRDIRKYINKHDIHVEIDIKLHQGTGDAAQTGMICGLLWSTAGILSAHISRHIKTISRRITIIPFFNKKIFEVDASCIFHVRLVHIIVVLKKIYYTKYLIKMKTKKSIGGEVSG